MERGKSSSTRGKGKTQLYPTDLFALGSKSSSVESTKRSLNAGPSDRKRESSSAILNPKKAKTGTVGASSALGRATSTPSSSATSSSDSWEALTLDCDPRDLVNTVIAAHQTGKLDRCAKVICGAIKVLKNTKWKPDPVLILGLTLIAKLRPSLFNSDLVTQALSVLLKRDPLHNFKSKGNPTVSVLAANLLLRGYHSQKHWPINFIKLYVEDSMSERVWVDLPECKAFVDNLQTAFDTKLPPKNLSLVFPDVGPVGPMRSDSPLTITLEEDDDTHGSSAAGEFLPVQYRFNKFKIAVEQILTDIQTNRRPESITRNYLRLISSASGMVDIRLMAALKLELWLQNPKLMKPSQELLMTICLNCNTHSEKDVQVIAALAKIRLKTKALITYYLACIRELINAHSDNLSTLIKHIVYNELSTSRNPNNMSILGVMFQSSPEASALLLADIFIELLLNRDDYHRPLRALLREIVRQLRHDINLHAFCRGLMTDKRDSQVFRDFEFKERMFYSLADLISLACFLGVSPAIKEAATVVGRADNQLLANYHKNVAKISRDAVTWLKEVVPKMFKPTPSDFIHAVHKVLFVEQLDAYYKVDMWPPESERVLLLRLASEGPLLQTTFINILYLGLSKEHPFPSPDALELADQLVKRSAGIDSENQPMLKIDKPCVFDLIFDLTAYHHPENITLPSGYSPPRLAISNLYWKAWVMLLLLTAHNPATLGAIAWEKYSMLRMLMEMCITNYFTYPPPTTTNTDDIKSQELQITAAERHGILEFESHLAAASTKQMINEQTSLLLPQLITMDPTGPARRPPSTVLEQLRLLNQTHRLGHLLCRSRLPDFLLDLIQRQGPSQSMPWLADLVENSEGSLSHLPVQCLCEFLLSTGLSDKQTRSQQLITHLRQVLTDPKQDPNAACEVLEYLLRRLSSPQMSSRMQAIKGLRLVFKDDSIETQNSWLVNFLPKLPHFDVVRPQVVSALRQACQVENDPCCISSYIAFLALYTGCDSLGFLGQLVQDMAQLIVERSTIMAAIMPFGQYDKTKSDTLHSLMIIFCTYLEKAREPRKEAYQWSESQDQILVTWSSGEGCTMHILVVHAMIILLSYGPGNDPILFSMLLESWFPTEGESPKAFLVDTSEEALLIPDWLKLRMIRSGVDRLVDAALVDLDVPQLVLFIQSFGIPVSSMSKLLETLDRTEPSLIASAVFDKAYMAQLVQVQKRRGATGGQRFVHALKLAEPLPTDISLDSSPGKRPPLLLPSVGSLMERKRRESCLSDFPNLIHTLFGPFEPMSVKKTAFHKLQRIIFVELKTPKEKLHACSLIINNIHYLMRTGELPRIIGLLEQDAATATSFFRLLSNIISQGSENIEYISCCKAIYENLTCKDTSNPLAAVLLNILPQKKCSKNTDDTLPVEKITQALLEDNELKNEMIGQLIDCLVSSEPELVGSCSSDQMRLLFGKSLNNARLPDGSNAETCRPYLLTLLTHRASWAKLHDCVQHLLSKCDSSYSATAVLDFLEALTRNPRLWQGREKHVPKHRKLESVLKLNKQQVLCLIDYVKTEAITVLEDNQRSSSTQDNQESSRTQDRPQFLDALEARLPILLECLDKNYLSEVVQCLAFTSKQKSHEGEVCHQILVLLYYQIPGLIRFLFGSEEQQTLTNATVTGWSSSILDRISHTLLTAMTASNIPSNLSPKDWTRRCQDFELAARKMAVVHPVLMLRQLPMLAASLRGRVHLEYSALRSRNHINVFSHVLGLLELLQPQVFLGQYTESFHSLLDSFLSLLKQNGHMKDIAHMIPRFVNLLQNYVVQESQRATKYINSNSQPFSVLKRNNPQVECLRTLLASIVVQRDDTGDTDADILLHPSSYTGPLPELPASIINVLSNPNNDDVYPALQDLEHISFRSPGYLEQLSEQITALMLSPYHNIRSLAHTLFVRLLKHNPKSNALTGYLKCLESNQGEIVTSALEKLPEVTVSLQENAALVLQKVFSLGVRSSLNTAPDISKAISLLNIQKGC